MPGETAEHPTPEPPPSDERLRAEYLSVFCCPPNIARTLARTHEFAMSTSADALWVHLYGNAEADATLGDGRSATVRVESEQPWGERTTLTVTAATDGGVPLRLRIPAWAESATLAVNGGPAEPVESGSYASVDRDWQIGDTVELTFPLRVRIRRGHRLAEELANQVAVTRGAVVYALESHELPEGVRLEQVALRRGVDFTPVDVELGGQRLVALDGEAVVLPTEEDEALYSDVEDGTLRTIPVRLIPYFAWGNRGPSEMSVWLPLVW
jgi:DUF1680 family protein